MFAARILYLFFSVAFACGWSMLWLKCGWKQVLSYVLVFAGAGAAEFSN